MLYIPAFKATTRDTLINEMQKVFKRLNLIGNNFGKKQELHKDYDVCNHNNYTNISLHV
jgi:hypothetical protein